MQNNGADWIPACTACTLPVVKGLLVVLKPFNCINMIRPKLGQPSTSHTRKLANGRICSISLCSHTRKCQCPFMLSCWQAKAVSPGRLPTKANMGTAKILVKMAHIKLQH